VSGFKAGHRRPGQLQGGQGKGKSRSGGGGLAQEEELGGGYGVSDWKNSGRWWSAALFLAAGRLACRGAQRGSARGGAWPGGPLSSRSIVPRRGVRHPGRAESPGRARRP
jgi:hypothetical protein